MITGSESLQKEIIENIKGPCVVLAGAGTGKTHTIVEKLGHLIKNKIYKPQRIVCITFSNEAANNLSLRVQKLFGGLQSQIPVIRTFHGFSADLLREHGAKIGVSSEFKILDSEEAKIILHRNFKVKPYYCHKYVSSINSAKDLGIGFNQISEYLDKRLVDYAGVELEKKLEDMQFSLQTQNFIVNKSEKQALVKDIEQLKELIQLKKFLSAWRAYEKIKEKKNYLDYSDLNKKTLELLDVSPEIANNYDYVIVDEFQDTNKVQLDILFLIAKLKNIMIVGDLNQSIYRFRGAYKNTFDEFKKKFNVSDKEIHALDKSFRSPNKVLELAHRLIVHNYENPDECFFVKNVREREGENIEVYELKNSKEEARKIAEVVQREKEKGNSYEDICVLFRTHQQGRILRKTFEQLGIPYSAVSKQSLLKHPYVELAKNYLSIVYLLSEKKKGGERAWWDLFFRLHFSEQDLALTGKFIRDNSKNECLSECFLNEFNKTALSEEAKLTAKTVFERINSLLPFAKSDAHTFLGEVYRVCGFLQEGEFEKDKTLLPNITKFLELAKNHGEIYEKDIESFLYYLDSVEQLEIEIEPAEIYAEGVRLMTLHATKGLEYKTVIISNLAQGRFPEGRVRNYSLIPSELSPELQGKLDKFSEEEKEEFIMNYEREHQLLEERRLCYVAFTRAKERLVLTFAREYSEKPHAASQFLFEVSYREHPAMSLEVDISEKYEEMMKGAISNSEEIKQNHILNNFANKEFSPSALLTFNECQKQYEYKYVFNMPEPRPPSWESMLLGSFVHAILDYGVKHGFASAEQFLEFARELHLKEEWASVVFEEAEQLIKVFFERNKNKYSSDSQTEQSLRMEIEGIKFVGFADRIDFHEEGMEIIDYKTGVTPITPRHRDWQLGYYALAAGEFGKVKRITLEMLKQERPISFDLSEDGTAVALPPGRVKFNIHAVREEIVETAKQILECSKTGFKACPIEKNCEFCNEYVHKL